MYSSVLHALDINTDPKLSFASQDFFIDWFRINLTLRARMPSISQMLPVHSSSAV